MMKPKLVFRNGVVVRRRDIVGNEVIITDGDGKEIGRRLLTEAEIALDAAKDQPTPDAVLVGEVEAAADFDALRAAIVKRFRD